MMKRLLTALLLIATAIVPITGLPRQGQISTGTAVGANEVRLGLPEFLPRTGDAQLARLTGIFNTVLWDDLDYSGNITLVSRSFQPVGRFSAPTDIKVDDWTKAGVAAQYLVFGNARLADGKLKLESRLWDLGVTQNRDVIAVDLGSGDLSETAVRATAHLFADMIIDKLFGGRIGIARTQIAYVATTGKDSKGRDAKEIYTIDYDGANPQPLTGYRSQSVTPAWSPDGDKIAFNTYRRNTSALEILSQLDRRPLPFPAFEGTNTTPAGSPDGGQLAFSSSKDGNMEIYVSDWNGRNPRRLTNSPKIDMSPAWNIKTGRQIAFMSDRSGSQQIYIMDTDGSNVEQLIREGGDAENPSWSPDGQNIAFAWQRTGTGKYDIYIHNLATGKNSQLTSNSGDNERPSWAPDGRHLVFASTRTGVSQIYAMLANGQKVRQLTRSGKNEGPAWSSFIGK